MRNRALEADIIQQRLVRVGSTWCEKRRESDYVSTEEVLEEDGWNGRGLGMCRYLSIVNGFPGRERIDKLARNNLDFCT